MRGRCRCGARAHRVRAADASCCLEICMTVLITACRASKGAEWWRLSGLGSLKAGQELLTPILFIIVGSTDLQAFTHNAQAGSPAHQCAQVACKQRKGCLMRIIQTMAAGGSTEVLECAPWQCSGEHCNNSKGREGTCCSVSRHVCCARLHPSCWLIL